MDIENIVSKYTGHEVSWTDLLTTHDHPVGVLLSHAVERAAYAVGQVDADLTRLCASIGDTIEGVRGVVSAALGEPVRSLNSLGELQANGPRIDALIAARDDRISHLRIITALWRKFAALLAPADLPVALAEAGFAPITPAHSSTRAAYGHRHGDRRITVSLDPYGEPGTEINLCRSDTLVWSITAGVDVPDSVVAAIASAALT